MKDITHAILTSLFVLLSLISLVSADLTPSPMRSQLVDRQAHVSDLGLRFVFNR